MAGACPSFEPMLLSGLRVLVGPVNRVAGVCARLFIELGARVETIGCVSASHDSSHAAASVFDYLFANSSPAEPLRSDDLGAGQDIVILCGSLSELREQDLWPAPFDTDAPGPICVYITPFGLYGPNAEKPASDLSLFAASGIASILTGKVDDLEEPPLRAVGQQSAYIAGIAAACVAMHGVLARAQSAPKHHKTQLVDVSIQESLATLAIDSLTRGGAGHPPPGRLRTDDGNGATVCILPASNGFVAISPREDHQWAAWLKVMGDPDWAGAAALSDKAGRAAHWDHVHARMSEWSQALRKEDIAERAQHAHVPAFELATIGEQLDSEQLRSRAFFRPFDCAGTRVNVPKHPFNIAIRQATENPEAPMSESSSSGRPLRVLDFSWVIAGPTATRYLSVFGADVIKTEAPGRGDPGRRGNLHTVLGRGKRAIALNLKCDTGLQLAKRLVAASDVLIENFATGVMARLGLTEGDLFRLNPELILVSASGLGRTGPKASAVAYGTLLQCYSGFAALNRHPQRPPRVGMAWLDPMCGLLLAFITAAARWHQLEQLRRDKAKLGIRIDFSMVESMLWTLAEPIIHAGLGRETQAQGNRSDCLSPHGIYRVPGEDAWLAVAVPNDSCWRDFCARQPSFDAYKDMTTQVRFEHEQAIETTLKSWLLKRTCEDSISELERVGIACAQVVHPASLYADSHLTTRGFWQDAEHGGLPGVPWRCEFSLDPIRDLSPAADLGQHNREVMLEVLGLSEEDYAAAAAQGAFGH